MLLIKDIQYERKDDIILLISPVGTIKVENDELDHKHDDKIIYNYEQDSEGLLIPKANVIKVKNNELVSRTSDKTSFDKIKTENNKGFEYYQELAELENASA